MPIVTSCRRPCSRSIVLVNGNGRSTLLLLYVRRRLCAILVDTKGPEIRSGLLEGGKSVTLKARCMLHAACRVLHIVRCMLCITRCNAASLHVACGVTVRRKGSRLCCTDSRALSVTCTASSAPSPLFLQRRSPSARRAASKQTNKQTDRSRACAE